MSDRLLYGWSEDLSGFSHRDALFSLSDVRSLATGFSKDNFRMSRNETVMSQSIAFTL